jgi:hypothetical protein
MATPITHETLIGYIPGEDVYIRYTEYYGNGTIYGRTELSMPDGSPVKGEGKFKKELVEMGVLMSDFVNGSLTGDLTVVPLEAPVDVSVVPVASLNSKKYTVVTTILGFKVTREFDVTVDEATNTLYLEAS